jgi:hypothetical protein
MVSLFQINPDSDIFLADIPDPLESPHGFDSLSRRDFLSGTVKTALVLALAGGWRSTVQAAPTGGGAKLYAFNPVASLGGNLGTPAAAAGPFSHWKYRWVFNGLSKGEKAVTELDGIGSLQIHRKISADRVEYTVEQMRPFGDYGATLVCSARDGEPLIEWRARQVSNTKGMKPLVSEVTGRVSGSTVEITRGQVTETVALNGTLHSEATFLANPAALEAVAGRGIALLEGGAMVRPGVRVRRDPVTDATLDGVSATAWLMTGTGLLPTHLMVDGQARALCRTMFTTSLILEEVAA